MRFFLFHVYRHKMAKNCFFCKTGFMQKFKVFWNFLAVRMFFTLPIVLAVEAIEIFNFLKILNLVNFKIFKKLKILIASIAKTIGSMKNILTAKKFQNTLNFCMKPVLCKKNNFWPFYGNKCEIEKTHFFFHFFKNFDFFFKLRFCKRLKNNFFSKIEKFNILVFTKIFSRQKLF